MLKIWEPVADGPFDEYEMLSRYEALLVRDTASHLFRLLGYEGDEAEQQRILLQALMVCRQSGISISRHFRKIFVHGEAGIQPDYLLTDLACYLITINADTGHPAVAQAQIYFLQRR